MPKYKLQKGFVVQKYPKKTVIFDRETSTMYTLNETAVFIFNKLKAGCSKEEITQKLYDRYNISGKKARTDVVNTIQTFLKVKIFKRA